MVALRCDAAPKADNCASRSEKPMPNDRSADFVDLGYSWPSRRDRPIPDIRQLLNQRLLRSYLVQT